MDKHKEVKMKNTGFSMAIVGVWTVCMAVGAEPIAVKTGIAGLLILIVGLAMVLYQSYREEEAKAINKRHKKLFRTWVNETDLKKRMRR